MAHLWALVDRWRFSLLLGLLLAAFFLEALVQTGSLGGYIQLLIYAAIFAAVVRLASETRGRAIPGSFLIGIWLIVTILGEGIGGTVMGSLAITVSIALVGWITACTVSLLVVERKADGDALAGAVFGFFLLALLWALFYTTLEVRYPGSIAIPEGSQIQTEMLYFSIVTITTLGYGDILPMTPFAKIMAGIEAAIGTLYLAILIGRIVGVFRSAKRRGANDE